MKAHDIIAYMESLRNEKQQRVMMRFFKTAPGEYGYGDKFIGLKNPQTREIVSVSARQLPLSEVPTLLMSQWHEVRLCGWLVLVYKFERLSTKRLYHDEAAIRARDEMVTLYLNYAERANNWDLVDLSAPKIIGHWLLLPSYLGDKRKIIDGLAVSDNLWRQRISMVCTWWTSAEGDPTWCWRYAKIHLKHPHDLMHKAVGWMLREMGKRVSINLLRDFLSQYGDEMSRTTLRYAIEKMSEEERMHWMKKGKSHTSISTPVINR